LGKVLDKLKDDLESLIDQINLTHDESFMMGTMDPWENELKPFREYMEHAFEKKNRSGCRHRCNGCPLERDA
jgi:hypothetical protein